MNAREWIIRSSQTTPRHDVAFFLNGLRGTRRSGKRPYADSIFSRAVKNPSISAFDPMVMRDTVGHAGNVRAISTPRARNAACISLDVLVFQSIISIFAWLGPM